MRDEGWVHWPTVVAVAVVVFGMAISWHELGHVAAGFLGGGRPTFVSSTDTRGEWAGMGDGGFVALGASGSLVNVLLAALGLALLSRLRRRGNDSATTTSIGARHFSGGGPSGASLLFAWLLFAADATLVGIYLAVSPIAAFGDWDTVTKRFGPQLPIRLLLSAAGVGIAVWATRTAARRLAPLTDRLPAGSRSARLQHLVRVCWLTGGGLAVAAALLSPLGLGWALFIAVGSTLGCTWPMNVAARMATEGAPTRAPDDPAPASGQDEISPLIPPHRGWIAAGLVVGAVFVFLFGPGIRL